MFEIPALGAEITRPQACFVDRGPLCLPRYTKTHDKMEGVRKLSYFEVNFRSKLSPGHFTSEQTVNLGHFTTKENDPLKVDSPLVSGQFASKVFGEQLILK